MANYFIRPDGNDSNTGLGPTAGQAWLTLSKALGATGIKSGDVLYVSPGKHTASFSTSITPNPTVTTRIVGDSNSTFFTDIAPGEVRFNHYTVNDNTAGLTGGMVYIANDYLSFENIVFAGYGNANNTYLIHNQSGWKNISFYRCKFYQTSRSLNVRSTLTCEGFASNALMNLTVDSCVFYGTSININTPVATSNILDNTNIVNNIFINPLSTGQAISITSSGSTGFVIGQKIANNHFIACAIAISIMTNPLTTSTLDTTFCYKIINNLFTLCGTNISAIGGNRSYTFTELQNRYVGGARTGSALSQSNICTDGYPDIDFLNSLQLGYDSLCPLTPVRGGVNVATGSSTGSSTDYFGATWITNPSIGPLQLNSVNGLTNYVPIQQSPLSITIAPGSTSQSIEVFLGAKGLTASTSGLSARYNRTRTASVSIPLVARTIDQGAPASAGVWTAGGFAEVDATNMPGVYRLDLPDAALAAGADDVTVVVRGASGTNGAVVTIKLSSGGLTEAQTASAVWGASPAGYDNATTFGGVINQIDTLANGIDTNVTQTPILVWDELTSSHTTAGSMGERMQPNKLADEILARDIGSGSSAGSINERTVRSALRGLRNKTTVINNEMTVYKEDDTSTAWSATVSSSDSSKTITGVDPT